MEEAAIQQVSNEPVVENEVSNEVQTEGEQNGLQEGQETPQEVVEKPKDEPIPKGVQKRIDRAVRQKYEAEARANELERRLQALEKQERPTQSNAAPKLDQYDNIEDYSLAVARYVSKQELTESLSAREKVESERHAQAAQEKAKEVWLKKVSKATVDMPDYDDVVRSSDIDFKDLVTVAAIQESDIGPKIAYYLATHEDEAEDIAELTGIAAVRAIGRLEAKLQNKTVATTRTPAPITPVGGKAKVEKSPEDMSPKEFTAWRKKYISERGSR